MGSFTAGQEPPPPVEEENSIGIGKEYGGASRASRTAKKSRSSSSSSNPRVLNILDWPEQNEHRASYEWTEKVWG